MLNFFTNAFPSIGFLPHGQCFLWVKELLLLHVVSDSLIALAYYSIPIALVCFVYKRKDLEFGWMFMLFAAFILACGTTHILGVWTIWEPAYWLSGLVKAITAAVSLSTAVLVWMLMPTALALPSPVQLRQANEELRREMIQHHEALVALQESEARFRSTFDYAAIGMGLVSLEGRWLKVNHCLCEIVGYSEQELLAMDFQSLTHPDDLAIDLGYVQELLEGKRRNYHLEKRYLHKEGRIVWVLLSATLVRGSDGKPLYLLKQIQDVTERKRAEEALQQAHRELEARVVERTQELAETNAKLQEEITERKRAEHIIRRYAERLEKSNRQLERLALFDDLTGLHNRRHLLELLEKAFLTAQRYELSLCVMMLDADHFKQLNDTYGHLTGDRALARLGRLLRENLRISDIVGRYGGEEFCIALPHTTLEHAIETAEKLRTRIMQEEITSESGEILHITCSIGIAQWQPSITHFDALLEQADYALYQAKAMGRNRVAVAPFDDSTD